MTDRQRWKYLKASVQGTSHKLINMPCQDSALVKALNVPKTEDEVLILVASDGAGSAIKSADGAKLACRELVEIVTRFFENEGGSSTKITRSDAEEWIRQIAHTIALQAKECELSSREFACTIIAAIVCEEDTTCIQIGDGAIVIRERDNYHTVFWPQTGEYVNSTFFVTDVSAEKQLQFVQLTDTINEVALLTDGLQMLALCYATRSAHTPFFSPMFSRLRAESSGESEALDQELATFLGSMAINQRTDDDKTLVLATRLSAETTK